MSMLECVDVTPKTNDLYKNIAESIYYALEHVKPMTSASKIVMIERWKDDGSIAVLLPDSILQFCNTCDADEVSRLSYSYLKQYTDIMTVTKESIVLKYGAPPAACVKIDDDYREYLIIVTSVSE